MTSKPFSHAGLRRRILTLSGAYLPGYRAGGPVRSLKNLQERFRGEMDFDVVTADRDLGDTTPYPNVKVGQWNSLDGQRIFYIRPGFRGLLDIWWVLCTTPHDLLYLNSFFSARTTTWSLMLHGLGMIPRRPVVLAPHGEFSRGALGLKATKKQVFLWLIRSSRLLRGVTFQATSQAEAVDISRVLGEVDVRKAPNLMGLPGHLDRPVRPVGALRLTFAGRINRMKNLDYALKVLQDMCYPIHLSIVGPQEDTAYWTECQKLMETLPKHVEIKVVGAVKPEEVAHILQRSDVLLLPTLGENYGYIILEALVNGCIPVISDRTPWQDLETKGCGYVLPLERPEKFTEVLNYLGAPETSLDDMSTAAVNYGLTVIANPKEIQQNRLLFGWKGAEESTEALAPTSP